MLVYQRVSFFIGLAWILLILLLALSDNEVLRHGPKVQHWKDTDWRQEPQEPQEPW